MPRRYLVVLATFLLSVLLYVDRVCISTAKGPITEELGLSEVQFGWIMSSFAFGYALLQTPSGMLADRMGSRKILASIVALWSVFTGLTAATWNFASMLVVRTVFGAGEAGAFPGMARAVYSWIPVQERGLVKGINFSGSRLGAAITMPILPWMISALGWKQSFVVLMGVGFVWAAIWWFWFRDTPEEHPTISDEEKAHILENRQGGATPEGAGKLPIFHMLRSGSLWIMMFQYLVVNFTTFFCLTWLFPYVKERYGLEYTEAGFYTMVPVLGGAAGNIFSGWLVDRLYNRFGLSLSRKIPAIAGFLLAGLGMMLSVQQDAVVPAVFWLTVAVFGVDMVLSPSWTFCIDIGGRHAGQVSGTMNMAGNLGSASVGIAFPYLIAWTGGPEAFFYLVAGSSVVAAACWGLSDPNRKIEEPAP